MHASHSHRASDTFFLLPLNRRGGREWSGRRKSHLLTWSVCAWRSEASAPPPSVLGEQSACRARAIRALVRHYGSSRKVTGRARYNQAEHDCEHERNDQLRYTQEATFRTIQSPRVSGDAACPSSVRQVVRDLRWLAALGAARAAAHTHVANLLKPQILSRV